MPSRLKKGVFLQLEHLETRETPAILPGPAGVSLAGAGVLTIRCDDAANQVKISTSGGILSVLEGAAENVRATYVATALNQVVFHGGQGFDYFVDDTYVPCTVYGYGGDDKLYGGGGDDKVFGGVGNDFVSGGIWGNDYLIGGEGTDSVHASLGPGETVLDDSGHNIGAYGTAVAGGPGIGSKIDLYTRGTRIWLNSLNPFPGFSGSIHIDYGDITGDGVDDIIAGSGTGSANGHVVVYDGFQLLYGNKSKADKQYFGEGGAVRASLYAFVQYTSGVAVRLADLNNDGFDDMALAPSVGAGGSTPAHLRVWDGRRAMVDFEARKPLPYSYNWEIASFYAFGNQSNGGGGMHLSVLRQPGSDYLVASQLFGTGVKVFKANPAQHLDANGKYLTGAAKVLPTQYDLTGRFPGVGHTVVAMTVPGFTGSFFIGAAFDQPGAPVIILDGFFNQAGSISNPPGQRVGLAHAMADDGMTLLIASNSSRTVRPYQLTFTPNPAPLPPTVTVTPLFGYLDHSPGVSAWV